MDTKWEGVGWCIPLPRWVLFVKFGLSTPSPWGPRILSLDSFSNYDTIHYQAQLGDFQHFNAQKTCVSYQKFPKGPYHGRGMPPPHSPLVSNIITYKGIPPPTPSPSVVSYTQSGQSFQTSNSPPPPHPPTPSHPMCDKNALPKHIQLSGKDKRFGQKKFTHKNPIWLKLLPEQSFTG